VESASRLYSLLLHRLSRSEPASALRSPPLPCEPLHRPRTFTQPGDTCHVCLRARPPPTFPCLGCRRGSRQTMRTSCSSPCLTAWASTCAPQKQRNTHVAPDRVRWARCWLWHRRRPSRCRSCGCGANHGWARGGGRRLLDWKRRVAVPAPRSVDDQAVLRDKGLLSVWVWPLRHRCSQVALHDLTAHLARWNWSLPVQGPLVLCIFHSLYNFGASEPTHDWFLFWSTELHAFSQLQ